MTCIAIATDDGKTVKLGHFGDAEKYLLYKYDNEKKEVMKIGEVANIVKEEEEEHYHNDPRKARKILELLKPWGCKYFVSTAMGPRSRKFLEENGIVPVFVKPRTTIEDALSYVKSILEEEQSRGT